MSSGLETSSNVKDQSRQNVEAIAGSETEGIHAKKPGSAPMTTHGVSTPASREVEPSSSVWAFPCTNNCQHQPGVLATEADRVPEFSAQILPAGTAPPERTFKPNPTKEVPLSESNPSAADTIQGSTSADVHTGLGHPGSGQTSSEIRHDGSHTSKKQSSGLEGVGARVDDKMDTIDAKQRGLERDGAASNAGTRGNVGGLDAQDRLPEPAETAAAESN